MQIGDRVIHNVVKVEMTIVRVHGDVFTCEMDEVYFDKRNQKMERKKAVCSGKNLTKTK